MEAWYYETPTGASCVCLFKGITKTAKAKSLWGVLWNLWNNAILKKRHIPERKVTERSLQKSKHTKKTFFHSKFYIQYYMWQSIIRLKKSQ